MKRTLIIAAAIGLLALIAILGVKGCSASLRKAAEAQTGQVRAEGQVKAATDATGITANAMDEAAASVQLGRESRDVIQSAPGAKAPVDPALSAAARRRLCLRTVNRDKPSCIALLQADPAATPR